MFYLGQVDTRPSGYYAVPVDKSTYSLQPMANLNRLVEERQNQPTQIILPNMTNNQKHQRLITVNGTGELRMPPDQVRLVVLITSVKANVNEAKNSVQRRFEYVYQTIRKYRVNESDIYVTKSSHRKDNGQYEVVTEISSNFKDFKTYLDIYNTLVEKLDKTVRLQPPEFFHTPARIDALKRQTTIQAIRNAKRIGFDLANSVGLGLGKPIEISQESFREFYGNQNPSSGDLNLNSIANTLDLPKSWNETISEKTITLVATIKAVFELKPKK